MKTMITPARLGDVRLVRLARRLGMLTQFSNQLADAVAAAARSVVQVNGGRRPVSGLVYASDVVLTTMRGVGQHEHVPVRRDDGQVVQGDLAGWDPATQLAVLRAPGLGLSPIVRADAEARVGHLALAIARSWSNAVTATAGPLPGVAGAHLDRPSPAA